MRQPAPKLLLLLLLQLPLFGCGGLGVGYTTGFESTPALQRLEDAAGVDFSNAYPTLSYRLVALSVRPNDDDSFCVDYTVDWTTMNYGSRADLNLITPMVTMRWRWIGLGLGYEWADLELSNAPHLDGHGPVAALSYDHDIVHSERLWWCLFAEARYHDPTFDSPFGEIDGRQIEFIAGIRGHFGLINAGIAVADLF
jgi:hypothetical protein